MAGLRPIGPTDAIEPGAFGGPRAHGGNRELVIFKYTPCVLPHKAVGLTLFLNFEKILEDLIE